MRYVVAGASAAGLAAAEGVFELDPGGDVLLLSEEPHPPYCRPLISTPRGWGSGCSAARRRLRTGHVTAIPSEDR